MAWFDTQVLQLQLPLRHTTYTINSSSTVMAILTDLAKASNGPPTWVILGALAVLGVYLKLFISSKRANLPIYSTHSGWLGSWYDSLDYLRDSPGVLKAGYERVSLQ
jgi:hypothetical protein